MNKPVLASLSISLALVMAHATAFGAEYSPPRTSWGEPDIQGMWPINHLIGVPLQRNKQYGDNLYMSDEQYAQAQASIAARDERFQGGAIPVADAAGQALRQTSLIADPVDGQFPGLTDYGKQLQADMRDSYRPGQTVYDGIEDFSPWDRCITRGMPVSMLPRNYTMVSGFSSLPGMWQLFWKWRTKPALFPLLICRHWMAISNSGWANRAGIGKATRW